MDGSCGLSLRDYAGPRNVRRLNAFTSAAVLDGALGINFKIVGVPRQRGYAAIAPFRRHDVGE
jgi:hypothetical protein